MSQVFSSSLVVFDGFNILDWLVDIENFFAIGRFREEDKLVVALYVEGRVKKWFVWVLRRGGFRNWQDFKQQIVVRFTESLDDEPSSINQSDSVADSNSEFEEFSPCEIVLKQAPKHVLKPPVARVERGLGVHSAPWSNELSNVVKFDGEESMNKMTATLGEVLDKAESLDIPKPSNKDGVEAVQPSEPKGVTMKSVWHKGDAVAAVQNVVKQSPKIDHKGMQADANSSTQLSPISLVENQVVAGLPDFHVDKIFYNDLGHEMKEEADLEQLEKSVEPSWPTIVKPLEKFIDRLSVDWGMINHLKAVKDTLELCAAIDEVQPGKVKFQLRFGQSKPVYNAFTSFRESSDWTTLSEAHHRLVEAPVKEAILSGITLEDGKREEFNKAEQELEQLSHKFSETVLDATKKFAKLIAGTNEIDGWPPPAHGLFAQVAVPKDHDTATAIHKQLLYTATAIHCKQLDVHRYLPVPQHAMNCALPHKFSHAIDLYTQAIDFNGNNAVYRANSAFYHTKLEEYGSAILDASNAIEINPKYSKGYYRRGAAYLAMGKFKGALKDFQQVKRISPNDPDTTRKLRECEKAVMKQKIEEAISVFSICQYIYTGELHICLGFLGAACVRVANELGKGDATAMRFSVKVVLTVSTIMGVLFSVLCLAFGSHISYMFSTSKEVLKAVDVLSMILAVSILLNSIQPILSGVVVGAGMQNIVAVVNLESCYAVELPSQFMENWCYHRDTLLCITKHYQPALELPIKYVSGGYAAGYYSYKRAEVLSVTIHSSVEDSWMSLRSL